VDYSFFKVGISCAYLGFRISGVDLTYSDLPPDISDEGEWLSIISLACPMPGFNPGCLCQKFFNFFPQFCYIKYHLDSYLS
jgi:hypothetical protein